MSPAAGIAISEPLACARMMGDCCSCTTLPMRASSGTPSSILPSPSATPFFSAMPRT